MSNDTLQKVNAEIEESLNKILTDKNELFNQLREIKDAIAWYKEVQEARKEPGKAEAVVTNKVIEKLLEKMPLEFLNITFDKIMLHGKGEKTDVVFDLDLELPPIKPTVSLKILVNGAESKNNVLKISFEVNSKLKLEEVNIFSDSQENFVRVKAINLHLELYLLSAMLIGQKKKKIGEKDLRLEDLELRQKRINVNEENN